MEEKTIVTHEELLVTLLLVGAAIALAVCA